jgi:GGDEF domain-containing protein
MTTAARIPGSAVPVTDTEAAIGRVCANLAHLELGQDPLFPTAILRGRRLVGSPLGDRRLLAAWRPLHARETGAIRYRWAIDPKFAGPLPAWIGPEDSWQPSRRGDAAALAEVPDRQPLFTARLVTPIVLSDMLDLLGRAIERGDDTSELARAYLDEAMPKVRRDAASWVQELHAWSDTWALWALARRPSALGALHPFALAIADAYAAAARRAGGRVLGTRFPYHLVPLVSGSAQLATGLVALGFHPRLVGSLAGWVHAEQRDDGGWGDGGHPSDVLTTLVAADLLATLDPTYEPGATAAWFARAQRPDGWWRAFGPESTWLSVEIAGWLFEASRPFAERFRWPHLALTNRDRRTGLPFYAYFADLERLFAEVPGLADADVEVAFLDLAGFGTFNNAYGMARGDEALRAFAQALDRIPGSMAIRDGGDEFIVVGTPTATGLPGRLEAFRASWPRTFAEAFGEAGIVAPRVLTAVVPGRSLVLARNTLGLEIGAVKKRYPAVDRAGIQVDLGRLGSRNSERHDRTDLAGG